MNYTVWPLVQFINFKFLPLKYRVPFVSACGILWNAYLSLLNSKIQFTKNVLYALPIGKNYLD